MKKAPIFLRKPNVKLTCASSYKEALCELIPYCNDCNICAYKDMCPNVETLSQNISELEYNLILAFSKLYCDYSNSETFTTKKDLYNAFCKVYGYIFRDISSFSYAFYVTNESKVWKTKKHSSTGICWGFRGVSLKEELY